MLCLIQSLSWIHLLLFQVFLQHLTPLLSLSTFTALWLTILEFMDKYMHADKSDLLVSSWDISINLQNLGKQHL